MHRFTIYDYHYQLVPACRECAVHGGQRVIVLRDGVYNGQYKPDSVRLSIVLGYLVMTPDDEPTRPTVISFGAGGPPERIWVDGYDQPFFK